MSPPQSPERQRGNPPQPDKQEPLPPPLAFSAGGDGATVTLRERAILTRDTEYKDLRPTNDFEWHYLLTELKNSPASDKEFKRLAGEAFQAQAAAIGCSESALLNLAKTFLDGPAHDLLGRRPIRGEGDVFLYTIQEGLALRVWGKYTKVINTYCLDLVEVEATGRLKPINFPSNWSLWMKNLDPFTGTDLWVRVPSLEEMFALESSASGQVILAEEGETTLTSSPADRSQELQKKIKPGEEKFQVISNMVYILRRPNEEDTYIQIPGKPAKEIKILAGEPLPSSDQA
ncbi:hypothetical protein EIP91_001564 [Steccherinum ochraceum]|uniref:Uncharacterized protein n=1 Tax=Steccherinum ochraceum TaxID=92696 RepID=A0A4R0RR56_9APHY|nr:hypothetical protein EIP91_001564 [Steccherinum ochraceum]